MKTMKYFKRKKRVAGISLVLSVALVFNMALPGLVFAQDAGCGCGYSLEDGKCPYCDPGGNQDRVEDGKNKTKDPIDTKTGSNYFTEERLSIPCPGISLKLDLKYQSVSSRPDHGFLGKGWLHDYEWSMDVQGDRASLYTGDGRKYVFMESTGNTYLTPESKNWTLEENGTGYDVGMPGGMVYNFDSTGKLSVIHDAWGNEVGCSYGANGCLETVAHSNGRQLVFSNQWHAASSEWRVASIAVPDGASLAFAFNADGQFTQVVEQVDSTTYTSRYQYANGVLTNKINGAGFEYAYEYLAGTSRGTSLSVDGYYGHTVDYDAPDSSIVSYDLGGANQVYRYARNNDGTLGTKYGPAHTVAQTTALGTRYSYAENEVDTTEETQFDDAAGATWSDWKLYDDAHNVTNQAVSYGTTTPVQQFSVEYDPLWQLPTAFVDAEGTRTETVYTNGSPLVEKAFHSATESFDTHYSYTTNGLVHAITNANEHVTTFGYDAMGNQTSAAAELGPIITNTYDTLGFVQRTEKLSESGFSTGRITQYDNDAKGRLVQTTFADGLTSSNAFNALGYLTNSVDRAGRVTDYTYAPTKKLTSNTRYLNEGGSNTPVRIGYDLDEQVNVLRISEPRGRYVESYQLDIQERVTSVTNIESQIMTFDYSVGDFVTQMVRFDGSTITNTYDTAGRKETVTYNPGSANPVAINQSCYTDGELKTISDGFSSVSNSYDRLNRLTNQVVQIGNKNSEIANAFDPVGNVTNTVISTDSSDLVDYSYEYDAAERLKEISRKDAEAQRFVYEYNTDNGQVASVSNTVSGITCSYEYDLMDRATNIAYRTSSGSLIRSLDYEYNAVSMIVQKRISNSEQGAPNSEVSYVYDSLDRLVHESCTAGFQPASSAVYQYDLAGNRLSKTTDGLATTYTLGSGNRLASSSVTATNLLFVSGSANELIGTDPRWGELWITNMTSGAFVVPSVNGNSFFAEIPAMTGQTNALHVAIRDRAGNMGYATTDLYAPAAGGTTSSSSYQYDAAGCMTNLNGASIGWDERYRLTNVDGASSSIEYEYDVLNRKTARIEGTDAEYYIYDGNQIVADVDASGNLLRTYVWGSGIDNLLAFTDHTTTNTYYPIKDHQNTVIALADDSGSVVESYEYDAYGSTKVFDATGIELSESAVGNRYCFQGREIDWDTGLYYFRARWYNPDTGRWLSKDPIGLAGGLNLYVFVDNNPVNLTDPMGLEGAGGFSPDIGTTVAGFGAAAWRGAVVGGAFGGLVGAGWGIAIAIIAIKAGDVVDVNSGGEGDSCKPRTWDPSSHVDGISHG